MMQRKNIPYAAFLRGINVSGQKIIKMESLRRAFERMGFKNVRTFIQSGNVVFEAAETDADALAREIEKGLAKSLGCETAVMVRTARELKAMVKRDPFKIKMGNGVKTYVAFLREAPKVKTQLPLVAPKRDVEIVRISGRDVFCLAHPVKNGGYPNSFVEKTLGVRATTRNWATICRMLDSPAFPRS